jgi:hypothetical protein
MTKVKIGFQKITAINRINLSTLKLTLLKLFAQPWLDP